MREYEYKILKIDELYINPENYRYINDAEDEIDAIVSMFNVTTGTPTKEMLNLAKDIIKDGLNPFEMPIVCFDSDLNKYIVYEGNRRITCIKLMTQYKNNSIILAKMPFVSEIYKLNCSINEIQCVVYNNADDAKHFLYKIHQDINNGIGRKQWDYHAKMKADAAIGNKSKAYAIVEFLKSNPTTDKALIKDMDTKRWISKLERVVGFAQFREVYNITFGTDNTIDYKDTKEQVVFMMSKLVYDLIHNSATDNFRFKKDFENYVNNVTPEFKTQVNNTAETSHQKPTAPSKTKRNNDEQAKNKGDEDNDKTNTSESLPATGVPRNISKKNTVKSEALQLGKKYSEDDYNCLNEKGKNMLLELEALNIKDYPFATAALCRALIENILKLWSENESGITFDSGKLPTVYNNCVNVLQDRKVISSKEHTVLRAQVNKEQYITLLNTWIHSDTSACVSETILVSGWKNIRLLIEKYIDIYKK